MTGIQWTDQVLNPTTGCDRVSPGCDSCYAMAMAKRLKGMGQAKYQNDGDPRTSGPGFGLTVHEDTLKIPFTWKKPRRVFVNSMSDLFHDKVPDEFIARMWAVMAATPQHTYQILSKRHGRMRALLNSDRFHASVRTWYSRVGDDPYLNRDFSNWSWPLSNVWLGVSVEDQQRAELRIPTLLRTPAAVRFLSCEPLLGPLNLVGSDTHQTYWLTGKPGWGKTETTKTGLNLSPLEIGPKLDWIICGGESGPKSRPCDPEWIRLIVQQCQDAGIPAFVKQLGSVWARENGGDSKGGDPSVWPADLRVREFPTPQDC
jgi:protein gp37